MKDMDCLFMDVFGSIQAASGRSDSLAIRNWLSDCRGEVAIRSSSSMPLARLQS